MPLQTVQHVLGLNVEDVIADTLARGLKAISIGPSDCCIKNWALHVFDPDALGNPLRGSSAILEQSGFPIDTEMFVRVIARDWFPHDHPVMPIIRDAFADHVMPA